MYTMKFQQNPKLFCWQEDTLRSLMATLLKSGEWALKLDVLIYIYVSMKLTTILKCTIISLLFVWCTLNLVAIEIKIEYVLLKSSKYNSRAVPLSNVLQRCTMPDNLKIYSLVVDLGQYWFNIVKWCYCQWQRRWNRSDTRWVPVKT